MKVIFIFCFCVLGFIVDLAHCDLKKQLKNVVSSNIKDDIEICMTENNVTAADWTNYELQILADMNPGFENEEKRKNMGCTIACIMKKKNMMENSNINERKIHAEIDKQYYHPIDVHAHKIARNCIKGAKNITEECEKCFALYECSIKAIYNLHIYGNDENTATEGNEEAEHEEHEKAETEKNTETEQTV